RNLLLWRNDGVDGLKTGHTEEAGYCLVASAKKNDQRMIAAVFGTHSEAARATETAKLLGYGFLFYETRTFHKKGEVLAQAPVWKGAASSVKVGVNADMALTMPRGEAAQYSTRTVLNPTLIAPLKQGDVVGKVEILRGDKMLKSVDLVALEAVEQGGFFRRVWDSIRLFFGGLFS
ncbi:MAG: serine-type D-Ala-D-Ala carboxypeptidase, partial [Hydrogenophilales bacterium 17-61-76]